VIEIDIYKDVENKKGSMDEMPARLEMQDAEQPIATTKDR